MSTLKLSKQAKLLLCGVALIGLFLRTVSMEDMEWKGDEKFNFQKSQSIGVTEPWPVTGMLSGVSVSNPGLSVAVYALLAQTFKIDHPVNLGRAVGVTSWLGILLLLVVVHLSQSQSSKKTWMWVFAFAMVNPFLIVLHRKLWPQPFLPLFLSGILVFWFCRQKTWGSFFWGVTGALLGQIHMTGFFAAFALWISTFMYDLFNQNRSQQKTPWLLWAIGSAIGALPLIPWALQVFSSESHAFFSAAQGWDERLQFKYWVFYLTDPFGIHLGNHLGLTRGPTQWDQIADFLQAPLFVGSPPWVVGGIHLVLLVSMVATLLIGFASLFRRPKNDSFKNSKPEVLLLVSSFVVLGLLTFVFALPLRRYHMAITFPFEILLMVRMIKPESSNWRTGLAASIFACQLLISISFILYVHNHGGAEQGDYGVSYKASHSILKK